MSNKRNIFLYEPDQRLSGRIRKLLTDHDYIVESFALSESFEKAIADAVPFMPHLCIVDLSTDGIEGVGLISRISKRDRPVPVIVTDSRGTVNKVIEAMKKGARDYVLKPFDGARFVRVVATILDSEELLQENVSLKRRVIGGTAKNIVGSSDALDRTVELANKVAKTNASILILGESGVGKELIAAKIHHESNRAGRNFLTINCAALTDTLLESQLFGHLRGAFTGAVVNQVGLIEEADKGTLFLDEIGDISPALQVKLLRVLQDGEYIPLGATRPQYADVRYLAATNKNLEDEVVSGRFREDLYYRLNVISINIPPLRERKTDIPVLVDFYLGRYATRQIEMSEDALELLCEYDWPGNVRELENVIEMAVVLTDDDTILPQHLPVKIAEGRPVRFAVPQEKMSLEAIECLYLEQVYRQTGFHKSKTADILQITRKTLDRKLAKFGLDQSKANA